METEAKAGDAATANGDAAAPVVEKVKRKRVRKHAVPVDSETPGLKTKQLQVGRALSQHRHPRECCRRHEPPGNMSFVGVALQGALQE